MVAMAKAVPVEAGTVHAFADDVELLAKTTADDGWRPDLPRLEYWFRNDVAADLARLRRLIVELTDNGPIRNLAWTVFSSLIVGRTSVANARDLVHSRHHFRPWAEDPMTVDRFVRAVRRAARLMKDYVALLPEDWHSPALVGDDARMLNIPTGTVDLVFFSPPYVSALDYPRAHTFAVAWLSDVLNMTLPEYGRLAKQYIGTDRAPLCNAAPEQPLPPPTQYESVDTVVRALDSAPERAWIVARYFADMVKVFTEAARVTRPGGHVVVVVCPSNIRRVPVPTHEIFATLAPMSTGNQLHLEHHHSRTIHDRRRVMPYLEAKFGERMRDEYVLVFCRRPDRLPASQSCAGVLELDQLRSAVVAP
jgi:hypothetical protein